MTTFPRTGLPALVLGLVAACGVESPIPAARGELARGRLDRADALLARESDAEAIAIRMQILEMRARRMEVRAELDVLLAPRAGLSRGALLGSLRELLAGEADPVVREWIEQELSRAADRAPMRREPTRDAPNAGGPRPGAVAPALVIAREPRAADATPPADSAARDTPPTDDSSGHSPGDSGGAAAARATAALVARAKELRGELERAGEEGREAAHAELAALAKRNLSAALELAAALESRWAAAAPGLARGATFDALKDLAARRASLDGYRVEALALIRDEETYFYPYEPPAVSFEEVRRYGLAQRAVEQAVAAVRAIWEGTEAVALPPAFGAALREAAWLSEHEHEARGPLAFPDGVPAWIRGLDGALASIGIAEFAWTVDEARALRRSRAVRAFNERQWGALETGAGGPAVPVAEEREQVRVTNGYRAMMGFPALAWNARLMVAARGHSDFMAETGEMGHFEPEPARHSPFDRMSRAGYAAGAGENVHSGFVLAHLAHESWIQSSQHHRSLLNEDFQEMASARSGWYWTQDFGRDDAFLKELHGWRD